MPDADLSQDAKKALRRERIRDLLRSQAIALGFALIPSLFIRIPGVPWVLPWLCWGIPMGLAMPLLHTYVLPRLRKTSFLATILLQTIAYELTIALAFATSLALNVVLMATMGTKVLDEPVAWYLKAVSHPIFIAAMVLAVCLVIPIRFLFALSQKLGPGVLGKWLRGYYHVPREEERIFMFLDMKDSTTLAERLGNLEFSALVRDFFNDLTLPVLQTKAEVSHYIGDEAVLTWTIPRGVEKANCLRIFFEFEKSLERRSSYYLDRYGFVPEFKAGAHVGEVVATEVGEVKSEIVYHGDVLNTAARIQGMCAAAGRNFLISADLAKLLPPDHGFATQDLGAFSLKGKEESVSLVAVGEALHPKK
ncbi:MAG TPA: adenylate/guanylate cyclase domain-containing protein [Fimbriimonadaceae bacterium]|nr:adenylate/guanylate cyclase domain-containing protein [Fimbriimonadaceae bacterium]